MSIVIGIICLLVGAVIGLMFNVREQTRVSDETSKHLGELGSWILNRETENHIDEVA